METLKKGFAEFRQALAGLRASDAAEADSLIGYVLFRLGDAFKEGSVIDSAAYYYQAAIDQASALYGDSSGMVVRPLAGLARVRVLQQHGDEAWALYDRAIAIQRSTPDSLGEQMAVLLFSQGHVYRRQRRQLDAPAGGRSNHPHALQGGEWKAGQIGLPAVHRRYFTPIEQHGHESGPDRARHRLLRSAEPAGPERS